MCGITGKLSFTDTLVTVPEIQRMNSAIAHRGPDGTGTYISPHHKVGLGHQRLSIVDLSPLGAQPMRYLDRYEIVFNGEIYNFREERKKLENIGYRFQSSTDTEVIMALYDAYGTDCLAHIRGMFAFALYDEQEDIIFLARDRVGQKPLKYFQDGTVFIFASELKGILTQHEYKKNIDKAAISNFLVLQYTPHTSTGFANIQKLEPGHYLKINRKNRNIAKQQYWDIQYSNTQLELPFNQYKQGIRSHLTRSVHEQMLADVPVGAMLSGGVDSSIIVALMAQQSSSPIQTFSVGFQGEKVSELPYASMIAKRYATNHHELTVTPTHTDMLPELVRTMEEPFGDHGALPTLLISNLIAKHVKVVLNGDGGDENFAGYDRYTAFLFSKKLRPFSYILQLIASTLPHTANNDRIQRFINSLSFPNSKRYLQYIAYTSPNELANSANTIIENLFRKTLSATSLQQLLYTDFHTYLSGALLPKVDLATMAHSIEARSPFFDHELLTYTALVPDRLKIQRFFNRKYILKETFKDLIPQEILSRKKQGFGIPLEQWFHEDLSAYAKSLLTSPSSRVSEFISREYIEKTLATHAKTPIRGRQIWILIMLELWLREYFS